MRPTAQPRIRRFVWPALLVAGLALNASAQQTIITTVAGGNMPNNLPAASANTERPAGVTTDNLGNFYVAATGASLVFKVNAAGVLTIVAGNGTNGFSSDGGLATSAFVGDPFGMVKDAFGNLFISETFQNRIRRVDGATGIITTVAGNGTFGFSGDGGPATNAQLAFPDGIAIDHSGNLFIVDTRNNRVRRVDAVTGIITTVAGNGSAAFSGDGGPATTASLNFSLGGVAVDGSGNLFIADAGNNRVRRVDAATGIITTVAGNGTFSFSGDGGPATSATLAGPFGVAVDVSGNPFIADTFNNRIRRVDAATGIITTAAGNGTFGFSGDGGLATSATLGGPFGVAVDCSGNVFIADTSNNRIRRADAATGIITTVAGNGLGDGGPATSASLFEPEAVTTDVTGNLLIADTNNSRIRRVDASTGIITTEAGTGQDGFSGDGGPATSAAFSQPAGLVVDKSGNLFISDTDNNRIRRVDASTGIVTTVAGNGTTGFSGDGGPATSASLNLGQGPDLIADNSGNLFIADTQNNRIRRVAAATGIITTVAGNGTFGFSGDGGPATSAALAGPFGVAVDSSGNVFIADTGNNRIRRVDALTRIITAVAGNGNSGFAGDGGPAINASLNFPMGIFLDGAGNLFIADSNNNRVRVVDSSTGIITTVAGNGTFGFSGDEGTATSATLASPFGIAVDGSGNLFIADAANNRVRRVTPQSITQPLSPTAPNPFNFGPHTFTVQYPAGTNFSGVDMTVVAAQDTQASIQQRFTGTSFSNATCIVYSGTGGNCVDYQVTCTNTGGSEITCPSESTATITVKTSYDTSQSIINPGFLTTPIGTNNWTNIFDSFFLQRIDPTTKGRTSGFSEFVAVDLGATNSQGAGTFQFLAPLQSNDERIFPVGTSIPVSFKLTSLANPGVPVSDATAGITVVMISDASGNPTSNLVLEKPAAFVFSGGNYVYSLNTSGYAPGLYNLTVYGNAFVVQQVEFTLPAPTTGARISTTLLSLTLNTNTNQYVAVFKMTNTGSGAANGLTTTASVLNSTSSVTSLPVSLGDVNPGSSIEVTLSFPVTAGAANSRGEITISESYAGGTAGGGFRVTLP